MKKDKSVSRDRLVSYLDEYLDIAAIPDASPNGLQVQGSARVHKLAFAVDASFQTIRAAAKANSDFLIVHHGLFWDKHEQIVGVLHKRVAALIENDVSLYAAHLPLDYHEEVGNNVELARLFGLKIAGRFAEYHGEQIGIVSRTEKPLPRNELVANIESKLACKPDVLAFGPPTVRKVGIISGKAAMFVEEAGRVGCDTLVTGESSHSAYHAAKESGVNLIFGGHYATETVGVQALSRHLKKRFDLPSKFIPAPTGY